MGRNINWSEGFTRAAGSLEQGMHYSAQADLERMRDQRAENLARFTLNKQMEHEDWRTRYMGGVQKEIAERQEHLADIRETGAEKRQQAATEAWGDRVTAAQTAETHRAEMREDAERARQNKGQIAAGRLNMMHEMAQYDIERQRAVMEYNNAMRGRPDITAITDPVRRAAAIAADPALSQLADGVHQIETARARAVAAHTMFLGQLGDPMFQGQQIGPDGRPKAPVAGAAAMPTSMDNPFENPQSRADANALPGGMPPGTNPADNAPAMPASSPLPGGMPGVSGNYTSTPPTLPGPVRTPQTSRIGPLVTPPSLIPGFNPTLGNPGAGQPQLIQPGG